MGITTATNGFNDGSIYYPRSTVTWADLGSSPYASWSMWTRWNPSPATMTLVIYEDAGFKDTRLPIIHWTYEGSITVTLKIADTVDSNLQLVSPTTYNLVEFQEVEPVAGQHYEYTLVVSTDSQLTVPFVFLGPLDFDTNRITELQENVNTSTLAGTIDSRVIDTVIGTVTGLVVTAQQQGVTYSSGLLRDRQYSVPDDYVFQENSIVVNIVDKSIPAIRCFDLNGESIDAVVDISITGISTMMLTSTGTQRI